MLITRQEAAKRIHMSETWLKQQIRAGFLPVVTLGRMVRIDESDLDQFIMERKSTVGISAGSPRRRVKAPAGNSNLEVFEKKVAAR